MAESKGNPVMLIAIVSVLVVLLAGGVSYFVVTNVLSSNKPHAQEKKEMGPLYNMEDEIIANLADTDEDHFVKTKIALELSDKKLEKEVDERVPQIRDTIITILRSKETTDVQKKDGLNRIREEIMRKCNESLASGKIVNVYFTDFVMQ